MYDLLVIASVLGCGWLGFRHGLQAAVVAALELFACLAIATVAHEPLADLGDSAIQMVLGPLVPQKWIVLVVFAGLLWGTFALMRRGLHAGDEDHALDEAEGTVVLANRIGGAVTGGLGGLLLAGGALVTLSMLPLLSGFKPVGDRMFVDAGRIALEAGGLFAGERHEGHSLVIHGEPVSRPSIPSAGLTSEPWLDMDGDSLPTDADRFRDLDGNGSFTKDLYYADVDGDGMRRVGMIDKYVCGCWHSSLNRDDRPRPVEKKPVPPKPAPARPAPAASQPPASEPAEKEKPVTAEPTAPVPTPSVETIEAPVLDTRSTGTKS